MLVGSVVDDVALIDVAGAGELDRPLTSPFLLPRWLPGRSPHAD
jgi:hypothetical protein